MLTDTQMDEYVQQVVDLYAPIQEEYLKLIGTQIKEIGTLSKTNIHRLEQLQRMRKNTQSIIDDLARVTDMAASEMETIITEIAQGEQDLYTSLFDGLGKVVVPLAENDSLKRVVAAEMARTNKTLYNLADTYAKTLNTNNPPGYRKLLDTAIRSVSNGLTDYNAAIRNSVKQCADTGIAYIDFDSGYIRRLDSQVRMNVLEGVRTSAIEVNKAVGEEFGADGYEISAHALCAPDHLPYQGKQYSQKAYDSLISTLARPFGTLNCKHVAFSILMGISEPTYTDEELDEIAKTSTEEISVTLGKNSDGTDNIVTKTRYQWSQEQRRIETEIRKQKDRAVLAGQSGDMSARRQAQLSINNYKGQYKTISDATNLSERTDLMSKSGYHWVKAEGQLKSNLEKPTLDFMKTGEADEFRFTVPDAGSVSLKASKLVDSKYSLYVDNSVDEETVAFFESKIEQALKNVPENFVMPQRVILASMGEDIAGGYMQSTDNLFLNSLMNTDESILEFVNRNQGVFANTTELGPLLHEFGHKYHYTLVESLAKSKKIEYDVAKELFDNRIVDYINDKDIDVASVLSQYASDYYTLKNSINEIVAEYFSVLQQGHKSNPIIDGITKCIKEEG